MGKSVVAGSRAAVIAAAFAQAAIESNRTYKLVGRGHEARVALREWVSRAVAPSLTQDTHYAVACVGSGRTSGPRRVFPRTLVVRAAQIAGVSETEFISPGWL